MIVWVQQPAFLISLALLDSFSPGEAFTNFETADITYSFNSPRMFLLMRVLISSFSKSRENR